MGEEHVEKTSDDTEAAAAEIEVAPPHFVLVHGVCGGAWCWYKLRCLMESCGYRVTAVDLRGAGVDSGDANDVLCFDDYNKPLIDFLSALPHNQKVILVGHSAGGLSVTDATHKFPQKISLAIYVAATMLKYGFTNEQDFKDGIPDVSDFGDANEVYDLGFGLGQDNLPTSIIVKKKLQRKLLYQMSPLEDSTLATMLLRPGPVGALESAKFKVESSSSSSDGGDLVPRIYIKTRFDHVVKPEQQDAMIGKWPPASVYTLDSDHSPFFSAPFALFGLLVKAASTINN